MRVGDEVSNWSRLSNTSRAIGFDQHLLASPTNVELSKTSQIQILFRGPSPPGPGSITVTRIIYDYGNGWVWTIIKHVAVGPFPEGINTVYWDLTDKDGDPMLADYGQVHIRLYNRGAPVDSAAIRLFN